jgi:hypothetical protein
MPVLQMNGAYHFDRVLSNVDCYSRKGNYNGKETLFVIWKNSTSWNISQCKDLANLVLDRTCVTFYYVTNSHESKPSLSWISSGPSYNPSPQVSIVNIGSSILSSNHSNNSFNSLLYENNDFKDFAIVYRNEEFKAYKSVLTATSLYFHRMLSNEWKEKYSCTIADLESVTAEHFKTFLEFLYLQSVKLVENDKVWSIYILCDYLEVLSAMKEKLIPVMVGYLNCQNVGKLLKIVNRTISPDCTITTFIPTILQEKFVSFVVESAHKLAMEGFPFHEIEPHLLQFIFSRTKQ